MKWQAVPGQLSEALEKAKAAQEALKGNKARDFCAEFVCYFFWGRSFCVVWVEIIWNYLQ